MCHHVNFSNDHYRPACERFGKYRTWQGKQRGTMLVEVMVAGLLLVVSVVALGSAQQTVLAAIHRAEIQTVLASLHGSILDRMRQDSQRAGSGRYDISIPDLHQPGEVAGLYPYLEDISLTLHRHDADGFLQILCDNADALICNVCIGVFLPSDVDPSGQRPFMPGNRLCGRYQIG